MAGTRVRVRGGGPGSRMGDGNGFLGRGRRGRRLRLGSRAADAGWCPGRVARASGRPLVTGLPRAARARAPSLALWRPPSVRVLIAFPGPALTPVCPPPSPPCGPAAASSQLPSSSLLRPPLLISLRSALRTLGHWVFPSDPRALGLQEKRCVDDFGLLTKYRIRPSSWLSLPLSFSLPTG